MNERKNIETLTDPVALVQGLRAMGYSSEEIRRMAKNEDPETPEPAGASQDAAVGATKYNPVLEVNAEGQVVRADLGAKGLRLGKDLGGLRMSQVGGNRYPIKK